MGGRLYPSLPLTEAQRRLVADNLGLVGWAEKRLARDCLPRERESLRDHLTDGLIRAAQCYDPSRGTAFSTCAQQWLRHGATRWREEWRGRYTGARLRKRKAVKLVTATDLDAAFTPPGFDPRRPLLLTDPPDPSPAADALASAAEELARLRGRVHARDWRALELHLWEGLTLTDVGREFGVTRECARLWVRRALAAARAAAAGEGV